MQMEHGLLLNFTRECKSGGSHFQWAVKELSELIDGDGAEMKMFTLKVKVTKQ